MRSHLLALVAGVVVLAAASVASAADFTIGGQATGKSQQGSDGSYSIKGTYTDADGNVGTYSGKYTMTTKGFTSCRATGLSAVYCDQVPDFPSRCNLVTGNVTFVSADGKKLKLNIGSGGFAPPDSRIASGVCLDPANPSVFDTYLLLSNRSNLVPATTEQFSKGYGPLDFALGSLVGTSTQRGRSQVFTDDLTLQVTLTPPS